MRKIIFILSIVSLFGIGCEKSISTYSGESTIYIDGQSMNDSISIPFAYLPQNETQYDYTFRVNTMGKPTTYDRTFIIEKIDEYDSENQAIEGVDYVSMKFGEYTIPAGKSFLDITINFKRNPILLKGVIRKLSFKLVETKDFKFLYNRYFESVRYVTNGDITDTIRYNRYIDTQRSIKLSEEIKRQSWWTGGTQGHSSLGVWSVKKSLLICDVLKLDRLKWLTNDQLSITTEPYLSYIGRAMHLWLLENPTIDENGEPMKMGPGVIY